MTSWESILDTSLRRQWKRYRKSLKQCQRSCAPKAVHASRVECRRLLSQLELLGAAPLSAGLRRKARATLKQHLDTFDRLRDTQVQLALLKAEAKAFPETREIRAALEKREQRLLMKVRSRIGKLKTGRIKKLTSAACQHLAGLRANGDRRLRVRRRIVGAVDAAFARAVDLRQKMDPAQLASIHRARIAFKKFRYMAEALQTLQPAISTSRLKAMQSFQTLLGEVQDTDVFLRRLDKFAHKNPRRKKPLASFRHWLLSRRTEQIENLLKNADAIHRFWPVDSSRRRPGATPDATLRRR